MATVYLDSPTNSTMFTTCCNVAICDDQACCPQCGQGVEPQGGPARWRAAYDPISTHRRWYGNHRPNDGRVFKKGE